MTITLERPVSPVCDSKLANDIRHLVDNLDTNIYNIVKDYQEICIRSVNWGKKRKSTGSVVE